MRFAVTGGAGFVGSNLVKLLVKKGHDVSVIDNLHTGKLENFTKLITDSLSVRKRIPSSQNNTMPNKAPNGRYCKKPSLNFTKFISSIITTNKNKTATAPTYTTTSIIAKNSAPNNTKRPEVVTKHKIKNKTE